MNEQWRICCYSQKEVDPTGDTNSSQLDGTVTSLQSDSSSLPVGVPSSSLTGVVSALVVIVALAMGLGTAIFFLYR